MSANGLAAAARPKLLGEQRGQWKLFRVTDPFVVVNARQAPQVVSTRSSIKALSEHLGHSDPGFTLRTYTHLLPTSNERTRKAIDALFGSKDDEQGDDDEG